MFKLPFLNRDKELQEEYGLGKHKAKRKKKILAEKYIGLEKVIYTDPIDTNTEDILNDKSFLKNVDNRKMTLDIRSYGWFELIIIVPLFIFVFYCFIYLPSSEYYARVDVVQQLVETGDSSYPDKTTSRYGSNSSMELYYRDGISAVRKQAMNDSALILYIPVGLLASFGLFFWVYIITKDCRDLLVFNREDGTVLYRYNYGLKTSICKFDDTLFQSHLASLTRPDRTYLALRFPDVKGYATLSMGFPYISMSLYVWYMDKNRPLPLGTAFDAYREEDYLRRRAEGFPEPLYPSGVPTPEWGEAITKYGDKGAKSRKLKMFEPRLKRVAFTEDEFRKAQTEDL